MVPLYLLLSSVYKLSKFYLTKPHDSVVDGEEKKV